MPPRTFAPALLPIASHPHRRIPRGIAAIVDEAIGTARCSALCCWHAAANQRLAAAIVAAGDQVRCAPARPVMCMIMAVLSWRHFQRSYPVVIIIEVAMKQETTFSMLRIVQVEEEDFGWPYSRAGARPPNGARGRPLSDDVLVCTWRTHG